MPPLTGKLTLHFAVYASGGFEPRMGQLRHIFGFLWLGRVRAPHGAVSMSRRFPQAPQPSEPGWSLTGIEMVDEATYVMVRGVRLLLFVVIVCCYR